jgi:type IV fimbrial biogenesis protein FimT
MTELLITLAILAILLAIAVPRMGLWIRSNRVGAAYNEVVSDISVARLRALRAGQQSSFTIASSTSYNIVVNGTTVKSVSLSRAYPGVTLSPTSGSITFNSRGIRTTDTPANITLTSSSGSSRTMSINALGKVTRDY